MTDKSFRTISREVIVTELFTGTDPWPGLLSRSAWRDMFNHASTHQHTHTSTLAVFKKRHSINFFAQNNEQKLTEADERTDV